MHGTEERGRRREGRGGASRALALTLAIVALSAPDLHAQDERGEQSPPAESIAPVPSPQAAPSPSDPRPVRRGPRPMSLTISGGVSLGSYEAGYLYYITEMLKRNAHYYDPRVATGASAGSINAFMSILSICGARVDDPTESIFYKLWTPIGLDALLVPEDATPISALSRRAMEVAAENLRSTWDGGLPTSCDMLLGVSTTRMNSVQVSLPGELFTVPRTEERFGLRIHGRGTGRSPVVRNYVDSRSQFESPMLALDGEGVDDFGSVAELLMASAAFPIAFEPVSLPHCMTNGDGDASCTATSARERLFLDGGVFDNSPLRMASDLAASGLISRPSGHVRLRDEPDLERVMPPEDMLFFFVEPSTYSFPGLEEEDEEEGQDSLLGLSLSFLSNFIETARTKELSELFRQQPQLREQIVVSQVNYPLISDLLGAFMGFFELEFRRHDFYLGMVDAHRLISDRVRMRQEAGEDAPLQWVEPQPVNGELPAAWRPYACMRQVMEGAYGDMDVCSGDDLRDFRAVLQTTIDRLYDHCRRVAARRGERPSTSNQACLDAMDGVPPPDVPGIDVVMDGSWHRQASEGDTVHALRLLARYGFVFRDLGLDADKSSQAPVAMRQALGDVVHALARAQTSGTRLIDTAGRYAANSVYYVPPDYELHVLLGEVWEVGASGVTPIRGWRGMRLTGALQLFGLHTALSSRETVIGLGPSVGIEIEPPFVNNALFQIRLGGRLGYIFSSVDGFGSEDCPTDMSSGRVACSRLLTEGYVAISLAELVRIQLSVAILPAIRAGESTVTDFYPQAGIQFNLPR